MLGSGLGAGDRAGAKGRSHGRRRPRGRRRFLYTKNTNFGAGRVDLKSGDNSGDAQWGEGYLKPSLDLTYETDAAGTVYGGASAVGAVTVGDGDAGGFTDGGDKQLDVEGLYAGWRSGKRSRTRWARMRSICRSAARISTSATAS